MLRSRDWSAVAAFLERLYHSREPQAFPGWLVRSLGELVDGEHITWNEIAFAPPTLRAEAYPAVAFHTRAELTLAALLDEHPCVGAWKAGGAPAVRVLSDLASQRRYHRTRLYRELYRALGYEDQITVELAPPGGELLALAIGRARRGVSRRDRAVLEMLRPHIQQAYRSLQAQARARRILAADRRLALALGYSLVTLDARGRPEDLPEHVRGWFRQYFPESREALPATLDAWLRRWRAGARSPLVRHCRGRRLIVLGLAVEGGGFVLSLQERGETCPERWGLTAREATVLGEIAQGKTNAQAAAALAVSPGTVKKHLDNAYRKLGVGNRTAALARLRGAAADPGGTLEPSRGA